MTLIWSVSRKLGRVVCLVLLVAIGTIVLMRSAPGYFSDVREMDAQHERTVQAASQAEQARESSVEAMAYSSIRGWIHGDLGRSRQFDVPVVDLVLPRLRLSASLLVHGIFYGWLASICTVLPISALRRGRIVLGLPFSLMLAVPTGVMATFCLITGKGGPLLVLVLLLASRDFKFLQRALEVSWKAPHVLSARAQGLTLTQLLWVHVLPNLRPQILALAKLSLITALGILVPVEVIFDQAGLGQLAWNAAMNRDAPVLLASTMVVTILVALASAFTSSPKLQEQP